MTGKTNQRRWKNFLIRREVQLPIIMAFLAIVFATLVAALLAPFYHDMHADGLWIQNVSGHLFLIRPALFIVLAIWLLPKIWRRIKLSACRIKRFSPYRQELPNRPHLDGDIDLSP